MCRFSFYRVYIFKLMAGIDVILTASITREFTFTQANATILDDHEFRLTATSWSDVSGIASCAQMTISECPSSRGFVYASGTGQCSPLLWLHEGSGVASQSVPDGELYLTTGGVTCPQGFQVVEYGDARHMTCVAVIATLSTYDDATELCSTMGGHLASVKTTDKLDLVATFVGPKENLWIGIDDLEREGQYVWQEDEQPLTNGQKNAVFTPGEPNNYGNMEDCGHYRGTTGGLNDLICWVTMKALCETSPLQVDC